jgi:hypothetical protein
VFDGGQNARDVIHGSPGAKAFRVSMMYLPRFAFTYEGFGAG